MVRLSKFNELLNDEFGASYGQVLLHDLVLGPLGDRTGQQAIADGDNPKDVWLALCQAMSVPRERWHGLNKNTKNRHAE